MKAEETEAREKRRISGRRGIRVRRRRLFRWGSPTFPSTLIHTVTSRLLASCSKAEGRTTQPYMQH